MDPETVDKPNVERMRFWSRIVSLITAFEAEHHAYTKFYFDGYDLKSYAQLQVDYLRTGMMGAWKIPTIGRE